ncbi:trypsin-like peptidase domain-containing protein [Dactylosporangium siamense]|uniref:Novel STAND NTPase 1 domain-containing protein n=1 Tax=Dactylosporangium siamense TaxID=685454 RepID=A0A919PK34_9ACTN|nr:trypsin-like peptidase domain-containing protein [Dactylosporangium siamense]GIG45199.1 hypothetical protein Dsi01nite_032400 [Dactylosporangium siamense]
MTADLDAAVVRIVDRAGRTAGAGFAVDGLVVTCAHVVRDARSGPGEEVSVAFGGTVTTGTVLEDAWRGTDHDDIAVVRVAAWPDGLRALTLSSSDGAAGAAIRTRGFPDASAVHGLYGEGVVIGTVREPDTGRPVLQIERGGSVTTGFSGGPVLDLATGHVIGMVHSITSGDAYQRQIQTILATPTEAIRAACPQLRLIDVCPYQSLDAFVEERSRFFHGRDAFIELMLEQLRRQPRFLTVLGPSGSGKSSVVRAGLLAAVGRGQIPRLAAFERIVTRPATADELDRLLSADPHPGGILLVLDQFEEIFLESGARRAGVIDRLCRLLDGPASVCVVLVMRDDFYSRLAAEAPALIRWVERGLVNIPARLTGAELTAIVREPARSVHLRFEAGLAEAIVDDAIEASPGDRTGDGGAHSMVLPLLEFTVTQLWQQRVDGELRWQPYRDNGRVAGALTGWADDAVRALPPDLLGVARAMFTSLVHLGDQRTGLPDSRRRRRLAELYRTDEQRPRLDAVLAVMTSRRLLVTAADADGAETVELIHDVLLREWAWLRAWLAEDRTFLTWRQQLESWVAAWTAGGSADGRLLRGDDLAVAQAHLAERPDDIEATARQFIARSGAVWEHEQLEREAVRRTLDEAETARVERSLRDRSAGVARLVPTEPVRGLAGAVELLRANLSMLPGTTPLGPVLAALRLATGRSRELRVLPVGATVRAVAFSPDGRCFVTGGDDRLVRLWRSDGEPLLEPLEGHRDSVTALAFRADGLAFASGGEDGAVSTWSRDGRHLGDRDLATAVRGLGFTGGSDPQPVAAGAGPDPDPTTSVVVDPRSDWRAGGTLGGTIWVPRQRIPFAHEGFIAVLAYHPQRRIVASGGAGGVIRLWTRDGDMLRPLGLAWQAHEDAVHCLAFGDDFLVSGSADGAVRLWDIDTRRPVCDPLLGHTAAVTAVAASPDGTRVVSGGADRMLRLWQWRDPDADPDAAAPAGERLFGSGRWDPHGLQLAPAERRHREHIYRLAISPDGRWLATVSDDRTVRLSDVAGTGPVRVFTGHEAGLRTVRFSPDGRTIASAGTDGTVRLWDRAGNATLGPFPRTAAVQALAFAPGGELIAAGASDGTVRVADLVTGRVTATAPDPAAVTELLFDPTGERLYSAHDNGLVRIWSGTTAEPVAPTFASHDGAVRALAAAPSTGLLATGGDDRLVRLWDAAGHPVGEPFIGHEGAILDLAFTPDGTMLLSAARDGTIRLWALDGTQLGDPLEGHAPWATSVVTTPDGAVALSVGSDGTLRRWRLGDWRTWLTEGCGRLRRHPLLALPANEALRDFCARLEADPEGAFVVDPYEVPRPTLPTVG